MSRERDPTVKEKSELCTVCEAVTDWRLHKVGFDRNGNQRYRWRCVECHSRNNRKRQRGV
jgi:hypothetical protein